MSKPIVVIVSGAVSRLLCRCRSFSPHSPSSRKQNRGIGEAICRGVLSLSQPVILYAASRAGKDLHFNPNASTGSQVKYPKLDITDKESIQRLVAEIQSSENGIDALINNAGVNVDQQYSLENVNLTLATNYDGTLSVSFPTNAYPCAITQTRTCRRR
jgi:NAD(P)-dependent dehydrogenase (short-subunit alcohol dehydrogenase family)